MLNETSIDALNIKGLAILAKDNVSLIHQLPELL